MQEVEARRYRITAVLGKGGFGKVYRAVMEGAGGFHKDVAIKLLRDEDVPELTLQRFRDEARILGLVRDRAIVNVDPPTRLAGRWAVVMEYVQGASVQRLLKLGPIPATVVAEIVQEVARVLDKVYRLAGPDGNPLQLLHRDIKPANIQVTPDGEVKVLDFGIAKAQFQAREAHTQAYIGGTKGFIAPERLEGKDGPEGDVFSLGVTAHYMVTGERPSRRQMMGLEEPDTQELSPAAQALIELAARMRQADPADRPSAREVEEACATLRRKFDGPTLRRWAEEHVPRAIAMRTEDEMVGSILSETLAAVLPSEDRLAGGHELVEHTGEVRPRGSPLLGVLLVVAVAAAVVIGAIGASSLLLGGGLLLAGRGTGPAEVEADGRLPIPAPPPSVELPRTGKGAPPAPAPAAAAPAPAPAAVAPAAGPVPSPPTPAPDEAPAPAPVAVAPPPAEPTPPGPTPTEEPAGAPRGTAKITFSSVPLGADVFVDGKLVGQTPVMEVALTEGRHEVKMFSDAENIVRTIDVGRRNAVRYVWKGGEKWESHY